LVRQTGEKINTQIGGEKANGAQNGGGGGMIESQKLRERKHFIGGKKRGGW